MFVVCFISQWIKRSKHGLGLWTFPDNENPNMEKALFEWPIVLLYDVKAKYLLISRKFFGREVFLQPNVCLTNQKPRAFVSARQTNQIALLFLFCSRISGRRGGGGEGDTNPTVPGT